MISLKSSSESLTFSTGPFISSTELDTSIYSITAIAKSSSERVSPVTLSVDAFTVSEKLRDSSLESKLRLKSVSIGGRISSSKLST